MRGRGVLVVILLMTTALETAITAEKKVETFKAYADSDLCAHLMLGPISPERIECSRTTYKQGSEPLLVRLQDSTLFEVNKQKMLKEVIGELVEVTGETNENDGRIKLQTVKSVPQNSIAPGTPGSELLDVRLYRTTGAARAKMVEQIRHELAMMPYISEFDYISFAMLGNRVILSGWTVRITNRSTAYNLVKRIEGVEQVVNNIDVLPLGSFDMQIRAGARAKLQQFLGRYFWGSGSAIKIVVKNGDIILLGVVSTKADSDLANIQCNSVTGAFHVFNMLKVAPDTGGKKKG
ncbi:MAG TPA: BON domain-containing protein [Edaphobacter sp.]|nr:BON domain-containing protein [Edaphobacter sp.]